MRSAANALSLQAPAAAAGLLSFLLALTSSSFFPPQRAEMSGDAINKKKIVTFVFCLIGGRREREDIGRGARRSSALQRGVVGSSGTAQSPECPASRGGRRGAGGGRTGKEREAGDSWGHLAEPRTFRACGPRRAAQSARASGPRQPRSLQGALRLPMAGGEFVQTFRSWEDRRGSSGSPEPWGPGGCPGLSCRGSPWSVTALRAVAGVSACAFVGELAVVN